MTSETLLIFFISYIMLHIKPGPGQAFRIGCVLDKGFICALSVTVGVSTVCTLYFLVVALSYNTIIGQFEALANIFKLIGALYLIYLGVKGFIKQSSDNPDKQTLKSHNILKFFVIGAIISLSNPMDILFFMSILPNLVSLAELTTQGIVLGAAIVFFTGIVIDIFILTAAALAKESIIDSPLRKYLLIFTNVTFILIGVYFLYSAFLPDA